MRQTFRSWMACCMTVALVWAVPAGAITDAERAAAKQTVEQTFGKELRQARAATDKTEVMKAAQTLLDAGANPRFSAAVRAELARTAMELFSSAGTEQGAVLADKALEQWAAVGQVSRVERAAAAVNLRQGDLTAAKPDRKKELTGRLAQATAELAQAYEADDDLDAAAAQIGRAIATARSAGLTDLVEDLNAVNMRIQRVRMFNRDMADARQELAAAIAGDNPPLIKAANEKIGLLFLLRKGDPISAADPLIKAKHEWAGQLQLLVKRNGGGKLTVEQAIAAAEMLRAATFKAEVSARGALLRLVLDLCAEAEAGGQVGAELATRLESLRAQAKAMLEKLAETKGNPLKKALEALAGAVLINPDGTVQITYSFGAAEQLRDWTTSGAWTIAGGALAAQAANGSAYNNLRLRADRPIQVSFSAAGTGTGAVMLALNDALANYNENAHFTLSANNARWTLSGLGFDRGGGTISGNPPYTVQVAGDGAGNFTWTLNGQAVAKVQTKSPLAGANLRLGFDLQRGGQYSYRGVVIRGTPVADNPVSKSSAATPPPTPPPQPPPQPPPPRPPWRRGG